MHVWSRLPLPFYILTPTCVSHSSVVSRVCSSFLRTHTPSSFLIRHTCRWDPSSLGVSYSGDKSPPYSTPPGTPPQLAVVPLAGLCPGPPCLPWCSVAGLSPRTAVRWLNGLRPTTSPLPILLRRTVLRGPGFACPPHPRSSFVGRSFTLLRSSAMFSRSVFSIALHSRISGGSFFTPLVCGVQDVDSDRRKGHSSPCSYPVSIFHMLISYFVLSHCIHIRLRLSWLRQYY